MYTTVRTSFLNKGDASERKEHHPHASSELAHAEHVGNNLFNEESQHDFDL